MGTASWPAVLAPSEDDDPTSTSAEPADDALLNDLEHDVEVAMRDLDLAREQAISIVVGDSDFVPNREVVEVAFDLRDRMQDDE